MKMFILITNCRIAMSENIKSILSETQDVCYVNMKK